MAKRPADLRLSDIVEAAERIAGVLGDLPLEAFEADS